MRWCTTASVILLVAAATPFAAAQQRVTSIGFEVRDAATAEPLTASVFVDGEKVNSEYKLAEGSESSIGMEVKADAGGGYYPRSMTLFLEAITKTRLVYRIYLAPRNAAPLHNRASVANASRFLQPDHVDRAIALLEAIVEETSPVVRSSQFGVYLKYNLWRAYQAGCTQRFLDYCTKANEANAELLQMQRSKKEHFIAESISTKELERGARDIADSSFRLSYLRAKWDLRRNRPEDAAESLHLLIEAVEKDPLLLGRLKISRKDIELRLAEAERAR